MNKSENIFKLLTWLMTLLLTAFVAGCGGDDGATGAPGTPAPDTGLPGNPVVPPLGTTSGFTLLSFGTSTGTGTPQQAVTVTGTAAILSTITGNVGAKGPATATDARIVGNLTAGPTVATDTVTLTDSTVTGIVTSLSAPTNTGSSVGSLATGSLAASVTTDFNTAYDALAARACDVTLTGTLANLSLTPGVYCFAAGLTMTDQSVTLIGGSTAKWIFKIGTGGTGELTFTRSTVNVTNGCNVTWWSKQGTTITSGTNAGTSSPSAFKGTVFSGAGFTATGTASTPETFTGRAFAKTGLTVTDTIVTGCP